MQVEVEFYDEFGAEFIFPEWPGGDRGMPQRSKLRQHRLMYTHSFLSTCGYSISMTDTIGQIKAMVVATTPMLTPGLALALRIKHFEFQGVILDDKKSLTDYQVRVNSSKAVFTGTALDCLKATLGVDVNIKTFKGLVVTVPIDKFDRKSITCEDVTDKIAAKTGE